MKPKATLRRFLLASTALISVSYTQAAQTWNGGDADDDFLSSLDNWSGALPTWASAINFGGNTRNSAINDLGLDTLIGGINFTNDGSAGKTNAFNLSGDRIILGGNITTTANTAGSTITDVIDLDMILDATRTITTNQQSATVQHNLTISGDISSSGAFGIIKAGSGILSLGGNNGYTGSTTVSAGTLRLTNTAALAGSSGLSMATGTTLDLRSNTSAIFNTPTWTPAASSTVTINVNNNGAGSNQTLTLGGTLNATDMSGSKQINITGGSNGYILRIGTVNMTNSSANNTGMSFNPTTADVSIGTITVNDSAKDTFITLDGSSLNNSIDTITDISAGAFQNSLFKTGTSTWTLGTALIRNTVNISAGILKANGTITVGRSGTGRDFNLSGGELHYNNAGAVKFATGSTGGSINITGGSLDNTSGLAITTSTFNPAMTWGGNWTFIGSNGANSDLNIGTGVVALGSQRQLTVANAATKLTVGGIISGAGGLTKAGAGTLELSGINTYTGTTTVSGGTLLLSNASALQSSALVTTGAGAVTLSGFTAPTFGGLSGATGNLASVISNYSTVTGLTLNPQTGFSNTYGGVISNGSGATTLTKSGAGTQILSGPNTYTGITNINAGTLNVGGAETANVSGPLGKQLANAAGTIVFGGGTLQYSAANQFDYSGRFSTAAAQAIKVDTNGQTVTWATDLTSSGGSVTNIGSGTLTLSGTNTFGALTNSGAGTLKLTGSNALSGATTISAGTLDLGGGTATGTLSTTALNLAGGTFSYTRTGSSTQAFTATNINAGASTVTAVNTSTITLGTLTPAAGGSVNFGTTGTITTSTSNNASGILGGWATFGGDNWAVANGAGSAITGFAGTYSFTNDVAIQNSGAAYAGKMISVNSTQTPDAVITPDTLTFNTAGAYTLTLQGTTNTIPGIMVNSVVGDNASLITGGTLLGANNGSLSVIQNNTTGANSALTIGSIIANNGTSGLSKSGAGTLILTNANTYTGATAIGAGTLQIGNGTTGTISSSSTIVNNGSLVINQSGSQTLAAISGTGSVTLTAGTGLVLNNSNTYSGGFNLNGGIVGSIPSGTYGGFGTGTVNVNGGRILVGSGAVVTFQNAMNWNANFVVDRGASNTPTITWSGPITLGAATVTMGGSAAGGGYIHNFNGGILDDTLNAGRSLAFTTVGAGGRAFVTLNGSNTFTGNISITQGSLTIGGSGRLGGGDYSGNITISSVSQGGIIYSSSSDQILRGNITGVSTLALTKDTSASSVLTLAGTNTYAGGTTLNAGTLQFAKKVSQPASGAVAVRDGTTLAVNLGGTGEWSTGNTNVAGSIGGLLAGTGGQAGGTVTYTGNVTLGFDTTNAGSAQTYSGVIGNVGTTLGIKKLGIGTLILDQANTYSGATTVSAGTLYVTGALSNSAVTVQASGALGGSGTLGNSLTIQAGGDLNLTGATLGLNSTNVLSLTGGSLTLGNLTFQDLVGWDWTNASVGTYELIDGSFSINWGSTAYLSEGTAYDFGNGKSGYFTTGSLTAVIVAIPEPGAALLGGLGLLLLLRRRRH